jgi:hypothetical protein
MGNNRKSEIRRDRSREDEAPSDPNTESNLSVVRCVNHDEMEATKVIQTRMNLELSRVVCLHRGWANARRSGISICLFKVAFRPNWGKKPVWDVWEPISGLIFRDFLGAYFLKRVCQKN